MRKKCSPWVGVLVGLLLCSTARADVVVHNGSVASGGTGEVQIDFFSASVDGGLFAATNFRENVTHTFEYDYEPPIEPPVLFFQLAIRNSTDIAWKDYHIDLTGADFFGFSDFPDPAELVPEINPVVFEGTGNDEILFRTAGDNQVTVESSMIERDGENASLWIFFDDLVDPGEAFQLAFRIDDVGTPDPDFVMDHAPSVISEDDDGDDDEEDDEEEDSESDDESDDDSDDDESDSDGD